MDKILLINAIIRFVESHVKDGINYQELEKSIGLSYHHLRQIFKDFMKVPLKHYINSRKAAYAAFEIEFTDKTLLRISGEYNFDAYDTFTRLFKRETGITPNEYKKEGRHSVQRKMIGMGTYAPVLSEKADVSITGAKTDSDGIVLYGVPELAFSSGKCTPFPACAESVLSYIGQRENCSYTWLMAVSGAAFRFCWNAGNWDMGNSNLMNVTPQNPWELYERTFRAAGRRYRLTLKDNLTKDAFFTQIMESINKGNPAIALGIVGPPEACIITGYNKNENSLFGWSYFQDNPEFSTGIQIDESGCFRSNGWWDNPFTTALFTVEGETAIPSLYEILKHIFSILTLQTAGEYQAGQSAYQCWANDITNDDLFAEKSVTPILLNRFFCQADAETMIGEGRYWGAQFFTQLGKEQNDIAGLCFEAADFLNKTSKYAQQMTTIRQGERQTEEAVREFAGKYIRKEIGTLIIKAKESERKAIVAIEKIMNQLL